MNVRTLAFTLEWDGKSLEASEQQVLWWNLNVREDSTEAVHNIKHQEGRSNTNRCHHRCPLGFPSYSVLAPLSGACIATPTRTFQEYREYQSTMTSLFPSFYIRWGWHFKDGLLLKNKNIRLEVGKFREYISLILHDATHFCPTGTWTSLCGYRQKLAWPSNWWDSQSFLGWGW